VSSHDVDPASLETEGTRVAESTVDQPESPDQAAPTDQVKPRFRKRVGRRLRKFFLPPEGSRLWRRVLPWATLMVIIIGIVVGSAHAWAWTNSPAFCGTTCHTMPPQYASYQLSAHSRVTCVECHIGREFIGKQLPRKTEHMQFIFRMAFGLYEYPIYVKGMRPARDACETCHAPTKFSSDALVVKQHYLPDQTNTPYSISLIMKIGGGTQREGLVRGIHWHIENKVQFISTDKLDQTIPYVRVTNSDGSVDEYVDAGSKFDTSSIDKSSLKTMDCITCHNRVSHTVAAPVDSIESSISRGVISGDIPHIRDLGVQALTREYADQEQAFAGIAQALHTYYKTSEPEFYATGLDKLEAAIAEIQRIYSVSVFKDQKVDWNTHPDNVGHINSPGCFRCHDGKHLSAAKQAIRLECNLCHSIPVVTAKGDLVTKIEVTHGPEPASHLNANWISLHNQAYLSDNSCASCHTTADDGGTSNTSFCSNSACHGTVFKYAGFDAAALRDVLQQQLPTTPTTVAPDASGSGAATYDASFGPLFTTKCGSCHGANATAGLNLTTYAGAMKGSSNGPVIIPGDSAHSKLVEIQSGSHFANLSAQELDAVKKWIDAGAPEK
jgi:hypothetical protein